MLILYFKPLATVTDFAICHMTLFGCRPGGEVRHFSDPDSELIIFKSDVSATYRQMPMHFLYQLLTIITVDNERCIDWCNNFGNRGAQKIWQSFMSLVMWILVFKCGLKYLKCYTDNVFSFSVAGNLNFYPPYQ